MCALRSTWLPSSRRESLTWNTSKIFPLQIAVEDVAVDAEPVLQRLVPQNGLPSGFGKQRARVDHRLVNRKAGVRVNDVVVQSPSYRVTVCPPPSAKTCVDRFCMGWYTCIIDQHQSLHSAKCCFRGPVVFAAQPALRYIVPTGQVCLRHT